MYGTLLDDAKRAAVFGEALCSATTRAASLAGYHRVFARGRRYPVLVRMRGAATPGLLIAKLPARAWRRLLTYEGPDYRIARVRISTGPGERPVWARVFLPRTLGATRRPWLAGRLRKTARGV